jgi:SSS family solute:Na+ symporter
MLIPFIIVIPGIIAWVMYSEGFAGSADAFELSDGSLNNDKAFPWLISTLLPSGLKGLVLAALAAAIISSLASMLNSISTIFTMDIYKPYVNPNADSKRYVNVGRITALVSLVVAVALSPLLSSMDQMFQYIQEYTGLVSPGILAVFILGLFWKKATNKGAIWGIILSIPIALAFKILPFEMPFMDQMFYTFIITMVIIMMISLTSCETEDDERCIPLTADLFKTDKVFNVCAYTICILLVVIYSIFF